MARKTSGKRQGRRWSGWGTRHSNALDLEDGVFEKRSARAIALSLKRSAERSGRNLGAGRRRVLERTKDELRKLYGRPPRR
jgi:hypothetical protein